MTTQFNWLLYLALGDHLLRQSGEEYYRSAVSRAYYGVFCHIRDILQQRGTSFAIAADVHRQVITALKSDSRPEVAQLGEDLDGLRHQRNLADYRTNAQFSLRWARRYHRRARSIRNRIANLLP